jgi:hypothetical protein
MTPFQENLNNKLKEIVNDFSASIKFNKYDCEPNELVGHKEGDVYIEVSIEKENLKIIAFIYTDEASVKVGDRCFLFELPDYKKDSNLLSSGIINFIQNCFDGIAPSAAFKKARK